MRIDSNGQVGIGTTSISAPTSNYRTLEIKNTASSGRSLLALTGNSSEYSHLYFGDENDLDVGAINYYHGNNTMYFHANAGERFRIAGSGEVVVNDGQTAINEAAFKVKGGEDEDVAKFFQGNTSGTENMFVFYDGAAELCGTITINNSSNTVAYNTSSDYRLKQDETLITDGIERIKQLKPYKFNWKSNPSEDKSDGFFAHEVSSIVPEAVSGDKDAFEVYRKHQERPEDKNVGDFKLDENGDKIPKYQQIDQAKLVPLLTGALQEASTKIETLETKVTALENA